MKTQNLPTSSSWLQSCSQKSTLHFQEKMFRENPYFCKDLKTRFLFIYFSTNTLFYIVSNECRHFRCISEICKLRTANTVALQIPALLLVFLGFFPRDQPSLHVITITLYQALFGFNCAGFYKGGALISR